MAPFQNALICLSAESVVTYVDELSDALELIPGALIATLLRSKLKTD